MSYVIPTTKSTMSYIIQTTLPTTTTDKKDPGTFTTFLPGAGTVQPISTTPLSSVLASDGFGLSTQLIIWGMVGFVLIELIAIGCLLRYCCRARYLRRRTFKEKEIILADIPSASYHINRSSNYTNLNSSRMNLISTSNVALDTSQLNSLKPVLYSTDYNNETIMVDDIMSNYSGINTSHSNKKSVLSAAERMRQEMSTEDIYTLKFSQNTPLEPFDVNAPVKQHQSFMYNGGLNRPAFEIVSHADVRPVSPVKFETTVGINTQSDDEFLFTERIDYKNRRRQHRTKSFGRSRAHTTPIHLNYGHEEMVRCTGKPVEWQVARELRTTDWDELRRTYANEDRQRYRTPSPQRNRHYKEHINRSSKSMSNLNYPVQMESELLEEPRLSYRNVDISGTEQTKYTNYLLESSSPPTKTKLSSSSSNREKFKLISSSTSSEQQPKFKPDIIEPKSFNSISGTNNTSLFEQSYIDMRRDRNPSNNQPEPEYRQQPPLLSQTFHDHETNETFSNKLDNTKNSIASDSQANTDRYTYEAPTQEIIDDTEPIDDLNRSNVSVIDVTYMDSTNRHSFKLEEPEINHAIPPPPPLLPSSLPPSLPPSLHLQPNDSKSNLTNMPPFSDSNNYKSNDSEIDYDEEYFRPNNSINLISELKKNRGSLADQGQPLNESLKSKSGHGSEIARGGGDLLSEIKSFHSGSLRPTSKLSDTPKLYEKNIELLGTSQRVEPVEEDDETTSYGQAGIY